MPEENIEYLKKRIQQLEQELSEAKKQSVSGHQFFQSFAGQLPFGILVLDANKPKARILSQNAEAERILGVNLLKGHSYFDPGSWGMKIYCENGISRCLAEDLLFERVLDGEPIMKQKRFFVHANGNRIPVECSMFPLLEPTGTANSVVLVLFDISDVQNFYEKITAWQMQVDEMFQQIPTVLWRATYNNDFTFRDSYISEYANELLGLPKGTIGNDWDKYMSYVLPEYLPYMQEKIQNGLLNIGEKQGFDYRLKRADGQEIWVHSSGKGRKTENGFVIYGHTIDITQRKTAEKEQRQSEQRFQTLFDHAPVMIDCFDEQGNCLLWNHECEKRLGYSFQEVRNTKNFFEKIYPDAATRSLLYKSLQKADGKFREFRPVGKDGNEHIQLWANFKMPDNTMISVGVDLTEQKETEEQLRQSRENFYSIFKNSTVGLYQSEVDGNIISANPALIKMLGYTSLDDLKTRDLDKEGYLDKGKRNEFFKLLNEKGELSGFQAEWLRKDGSIVHVLENASLIHDRKGKPIYFIGSVSDVTEIRNAEKEQDRYRKMLEVRNRLSNAFILGSSERVLSDVLQVLRIESNSEYGFFGHINDNGDLVSESMTWDIWDECKMVNKSITFPRDTWGGIWGEALISGEPVLKNDGLSLPKGHVQLQNALAVPIKFKGEIIGEIVLGDKQGGFNEDDVTFLIEKCQYIAPLLQSMLSDKQYQQEIIKAKEKAEESDRLKSAFLATMSHELRTPLNSIIGFSELLLGGDFEPVEVTEYSQLINGSGKHLLNLIEDILGIALIESGQVEIKKEVFDLKGLMLDVFDYARREMSRTAKDHIGLSGLHKLKIDKKLEVETDFNRLKQVFYFLISNAVKFTHKGKIEIGFKEEDHGDILFYVKDTGIGISKDKQQIIFDRFRQADDSFTRKYGGTGLGLYITSKIIRMLGGAIHVESAIGEGSAFYFRMPHLIKGSNELADNEVLSLPKLKNAQILIVEDDENNRYLLENYLEYSGAGLYFADDGFQAIKLKQENPQINIVLMDLKLPGIDGYETTRRLKNIDNSLYVIAQTAFALDEDREKAIGAGCNAYLAKPIKRTVLYKAILQAPIS